MTQQYHLFFNESEIKTEVINLLRYIIKELHFFRQNDTMKLELLKNLSKDMSIIYNIPNVTDITIEYGYINIGCYKPYNKSIVLNKCSLVTFLHEYKHHINHILGLNNTEESARGFSHSLYFFATPKLFKNAVEKGLLIYQKSMD